MSSIIKKRAQAFKQQQLKAWQPILTPSCVIPTLIVVGVIFVPLGIYLLFASNQVQEVIQRYDVLCGNKATCQVTLEINMTRPIYIYYELSNFYQNHRRYVKSRSDDQLRGVVVSDYNSLVNCDPYVSANGSTNSKDLFLPCGLVAKSRFNDTLVFKTFRWYFC